MALTLQTWTSAGRSLSNPREPQKFQELMILIQIKGLGSTGTVLESTSPKTSNHCYLLSKRRVRVKQVLALSQSRK